MISTKSDQEIDLMRWGTAAARTSVRVMVKPSVTTQEIELAVFGFNTQHVIVHGVPQLLTEPGGLVGIKS